MFFSGVLSELTHRDKSVAYYGVGSENLPAENYSPNANNKCLWFMRAMDRNLRVF